MEASFKTSKNRSSKVVLFELKQHQKELANHVWLKPAASGPLKGFSTTTARVKEENRPGIPGNLDRGVNTRKRVK